MPKAAVDYTNQRFGNRLVLKRVPFDPNVRRSIWTVRCDCGRVDDVDISILKRGKALTCFDCNTGRIQTTHGMFGTPTYSTWQAMKTRCTNPASTDWPTYGGKGIQVCERWLESFENFFADMGERPLGTTIDRYPDPYGDYQPNNCRWATPIEQAENRSTTSCFVEHEGQIMTLKAACRLTGILYETALVRYNKNQPWDEWRKGNNQYVSQ